MTEKISKPINLLDTFLKLERVSILLPWWTPNTSSKLKMLYKKVSVLFMNTFTSQENHDNVLSRLHTFNIQNFEGLQIIFGSRTENIDRTCGQFLNRKPKFERKRFNPSTGKCLENFVKIRIGTCVFENFEKRRFLSIMKGFRFFVKKTMGKILALFDVFSATLG